MREIRPSGSEGGARSIPCPYPYRMRSQQAAHLCQLHRANDPALNDLTVFHAPTLPPPTGRVQPKIKLFSGLTRRLSPLKITVS